jgi:hypothetical protein
MDRRLWQKHEKDLQEALGLSSTVGSGNQSHDIGDGSNGHNRLQDFPMVIDCKATEKKSYSLTYELMESWLQRAAELGKMFLLPIRFVNAPKYKDYVVIELSDFQLLLAYAKKGL